MLKSSCEGNDCKPNGALHGGDGCDNEVQRTMLELLNQLDGFDQRGNIKVGKAG